MGYPAPVAQGRARGLRPERDPPSVVDLHGVAVLARASRRRRAAVHSERLSRSSPNEEVRAMDVDLPEVHARRSTPRTPSVAGVGDDQWDDVSDCEDWTVRELVNHIVTGNYWADELGVGQDHRGGRRPARRRRARRRPGACLRRLGRAWRRRRSAPRARWTRRARCRTGRCPGRSTAATASSTCSSTGGTSPRRPGRTPRSTRPRRGVLGGGRAAARHARGQRRVRHRRSTVPDDADAQTKLLAVLGRRGVTLVGSSGAWVSSSP